MPPGKHKNRQHTGLPDARQETSLPREGLDDDRRVRECECTICEISNGVPVVINGTFIDDDSPTGTVPYFSLANASEDESARLESGKWGKRRPRIGGDDQAF